MSAELVAVKLVLIQFQPHKSPSADPAHFLGFPHTLRIPRLWLFGGTFNLEPAVEREKAVQDISVLCEDKKLDHFVPVFFPQRLVKR